MANTTAPHEQFVPIEKLRCAERRIAELKDTVSVQRATLIAVREQVDSYMRKAIDDVLARSE